MKVSFVQTKSLGKIKSTEQIQLFDQPCILKLFY